ncbi:MAG: type II toxin-antitoxin system RelE/ParE family toxin [Chloroflexi bacterium]|nr:type II toxin-antitoxin system RelE/ParE family toxin [Chloroflexota bacterium]
MLSVRWSKHTREDIRRIADYWLENNPANVAAVTAAVMGRVNWIADGHFHMGTPVKDLPNTYRSYLERAFGYKIYYRIEGKPPEGIAVISVRHARQRPLTPSTLRKYAQ